MHAKSVLVLSADALGAVLLGALLEIEALTPVFPQAGESARDALRRARPALVMVDATDPVACSPASIGPAKMLAVPVVVYGPRHQRDHVEQCGRLHDATPLVLPPPAGDLRRVLREARAATRRPR